MQHLPAVFWSWPGVVASCLSTCLHSHWNYFVTCGQHNPLPDELFFCGGHFSLYMNLLTIFPVLSGFQPPNSTQLCKCTAILYTRLKPHPPLTSGNIHGTQPATARPDWDKCFPIGNGRRTGQEDCFLNPFVHRRTVVAHSEPTN